jgi:hypothetical protein
MAHIFISYVEENAKLAAWVADQLRANGLDPWYSKDAGRIIAGDQWKSTLRKAIEEGGFYLPLFTREWAARSRTVANEELATAVDEARLRGLHRRWFVPVKVDDGSLPAIDFGGGLTLNGIHHVDIPKLGWERGLLDMLKALGVDEPKLERGEPLAQGFGAFAAVVGGHLTYRNSQPRVEAIDGLTMSVTKGWVRRQEDGRIYANFRVRAAYEQHQRINAELGLDDIDVRMDEATISTNPDEPSRFYYMDSESRLEKGTELWSVGKTMTTASTIDQRSGFEAIGYLNSDDRIIGKFNGYVESGSVFQKVRVTFDGDFDVALKPAITPPSG